MKKILSILALAVFATAAQAITLNWKTASANPWMDDASLSATLVYSSVDTATMATAVQVAMGGESDGYGVVPTVAWGQITATEAEIETSSAYSAQPTGTYFIVFTKGSAYAATFVTAEDAATAWISASGPIENSSSYAGPVTVADFKGTLVPVPEPTALALLALGVAGLALRRRA